ncbi:MAG: 1-deoxy-D-xylulose-5-phosphate reductoisomerase [Clostridiales bacterium]|nr:1-deoxy-D-xylulose-5-phosphate reductoisomerase [Clostridiales bacterium]
MKSITILGSTGSIGTQALDIARAHNIRIDAIAANRNVDLIEQQAREFSPKYVAIFDESKYKNLKAALSDTGIKVVAGMDGVCEISALESTDIVLNSIVGMVGLVPTLAAIKAGNDIALANKETLVAGGKLVTDAAKKHGVKILPVDSEHSAIFQCLQGNNKSEVNKLILTASGGPFYGWTKEDLENVTKEQALKHPNWSMGAKITIDSATLMNKGLELIEAMWLFDMAPGDIEIAVHRQSIVHSLVEYIDYSVIAQLGIPDMRIPIQYALTYPNRMTCPTGRLNLFECGNLTFEEPDYDTFICLQAAVKAANLGGISPCIANSANEQAVELFLNDQISFLGIGELVMGAVEELSGLDNNSLDDIFTAEKIAREYVIEHGHDA